MSDSTVLCLTCLSTIGDGACISESMRRFLADELRFTCFPDQSLVCRKCYRSLLELRRFCSQLRDVELYYELKLNSQSRIEAEETIEDVHEADFDPANLDPISIEVMPIEILESATFEEQNLTGGRICSTPLRSSARLHHRGTRSAPSRILRQRRKVSYSDDNFQEFDEHQPVSASEKRSSNRCLKCHRRFSTREALRDHELIHTDVQTSECSLCDKRYLNEWSLKAHMKMAHHPVK